MMLSERLKVDLTPTIRRVLRAHRILTELPVKLNELASSSTLRLLLLSVNFTRFRGFKHDGDYRPVDGSLR